MTIPNQSVNLAVVSKQKMFKQGKVCIQFRETGSCKFGTHCRFEHVKKQESSIQTLSQQSSTSQTSSVAPVVPNVATQKLASTSMASPSIINEPAAKENNGVTATTKHQKNCPRFRKTGHCKFGAQCRDKHVEKPVTLNQPSPSTASTSNTLALDVKKPTSAQSDGLAVTNKKKRGVCHQFTRSGTCKNGEECQFNHILKHGASVVSGGQQKPQPVIANAAVKKHISFAQAASKGLRSVDNPPNSTMKPNDAANPMPSQHARSASAASSVSTTVTETSTTSSISSPASSVSSLASTTVSKASNISTASVASSKVSYLEITPIKTWDVFADGKWWAGKLKATTKAKFFAPYILANQVTAGLLHQYGLASKGKEDVFNKGDHGVFHYFPHLPGELRNKIYGYIAVGTVNNVTIKCKESLTLDNIYQPGDGFKSMGAPPAMLHVSSEARSYLLGNGYYELAFGTLYAPARTYVNFAKDRVFINLDGHHQLRPAFGMMSRRDLLRIKLLALPCKHAYGDYQNFFRQLAKMSHLRKVDLLLGDSPDDAKYAQNMKYMSLWRHEMKSQWELRWATAPKVLDRGVPKIDYCLIDGVDARFYGIDDLKWFAGQDNNTLVFDRLGYRVRENMGSGWYEGPKTVRIPRR
ncbi:uncharacterized protein LY89DRAFT_785822 [Mollisia scopiformis]|uniref:C3H1-type domain-containing protein n=1 Tax=Mollisia scopiformis TaxID=149040 RepID=A0A194WWW4_MOLSC|nr:uncharacterized protein LY89DRAFT_785822 [Mollisia scopiformis]KUJ12468.1 hypothetical protein LY89DRAFT_785822 [Mollisia scopiformis]